MATMMVLIHGLTAGPGVSLYGSPKVEPVTAAFGSSEPRAIELQSKKSPAQSRAFLGFDRRYSYINFSRMPPYCTKKGTNTSDRIADSLIRIFSDGPDVSLSGSPTVSPTTAAL